MGIFTIDTIRSVEWETTYLWEVQFKEDLNKHHKSKLSNAQPFTEWFPASSVSEELFSISETIFELHQYEGFPFPKGSPQKSITLTFFSDSKGKLIDWITTWVKTDILNDGKFVSPIKFCTKELHIRKLNSQREVISTHSYSVTPTGSLTFEGTNTSEASSYTVRFFIVGGS